MHGSNHEGPPDRPQCSAPFLPPPPTDRLLDRRAFRSAERTDTLEDALRLDGRDLDHVTFVWGLLSRGERAAHLTERSDLGARGEGV